jgi:hypothetical protein
VQDLKKELLHDITSIGLTMSFELCLKDYSKSKFGIYNPSNNRITLYVNEDAECSSLYSYESLLMTLVHECIHCKQWSNPTFKRKKGIMHDVEFKQLYADYSSRARARLIFKEVVSELSKTSQSQDFYNKSNKCG